MRQTSLVIALSVLISGCTIFPPTNDQLVQVPIIFGSLKCAFAQALVKEREPGAIRRLAGTVAAGSLTLKLVQTDSSGLNLKGKASGPFVFAFAGAGASLVPSFSTSVTRTDTITTTIDFRFLMNAENSRVCDQIEGSKRARYGFSEWLSKVIEGSNANVPYDPPGQIDQLKYSSEFAVTNTDQEGLDFDVVFLSAGITASQSRNDVQSITFTIAPPSEDNPLPTIYRRAHVGKKERPLPKDKDPAPTPKKPQPNPGSPPPTKPGVGPLKEQPKDR